MYCVCKIKKKDGGAMVRAAVLMIEILKKVGNCKCAYAPVSGDVYRVRFGRKLDREGILTIVLFMLFIF